jgi:REP element-mobilizing transposase RayT
MARPLRFIPEDSLVETTTRTIQGRLLLTPSPELNDLVLGVIGKAQHTYGMTVHAFVVVSNHAHFLLSPTSAQQLARFMQFVNANMAKEAGRLHDWPERFWSRRYRAIPVVDDKAAHARIRYLMSHGAKEGLVAVADDWPGPNCIDALTHGDLLRGTWHDRSAEYRARAAGRDIKPGEFTTIYDVKLTPLPCVIDMTSDQQQAHYRRVVHEIDTAAQAANEEKGRTPLGVGKILAQDPHHRPDALDRSPAPLVHAHDDQKRDEYLAAYRVFVINFRAGVDSMKAKAKQITELFPDWAFPPALPLKTAVTAAAA